MQGRHEKIIYENDRGQRVEIAYSFPYFLQQLLGADGTDADITKVKGVGQDGSTVTNVNLADRELRVLASIKGDTKEEIAKHRAKLLQVFNPKVKGWLQYEYGDTKRRIRCQVEKAPVFSKQNRSFKYQDFLIDLLCPNPFWQDEFETSKEIITWIGGMTFPLKLPTAFATKGPKIINIRNDGDVEAPVKIEFHGPATNPKIENNGEFIKVNRTILQDDVLTITTEFGNKRVEINGENAFNWIDLDSVFWQLQPGDNVIEYTSDDEVEDATVKVIYKNRYLGV
ncbi:phage tail family protein [Candidatus Darwinibacter acetoxidans]